MNLFSEPVTGNYSEESPLATGKPPGGRDQIHRNFIHEFDTNKEQEPKVLDGEFTIQFTVHVI